MCRSRWFLSRLQQVSSPFRFLSATSLLKSHSFLPFLPFSPPSSRSKTWPFRPWNFELQPQILISFTQRLPRSRKFLDRNDGRLWSCLPSSFSSFRRDSSYGLYHGCFWWCSGLWYKWVSQTWEFCEQSSRLLLSATSVSLFSFFLTFRFLSSQHFDSKSALISLFSFSWYQSLRIQASSLTHRTNSNSTLASAACTPFRSTSLFLYRVLGSWSTSWFSFSVSSDHLNRLRLIEGNARLLPIQTSRANSECSD